MACPWASPPSCWAARTPAILALADGTTFEVAGTTLTAMSTPGHSPGSTCLYAPELGTVFTGDTLFSGGPGATGRSYSDHPTILRDQNKCIQCRKCERICADVQCRGLDAVLDL